MFLFLLKFYSLGAFVSSGWQNLITVFRFEFRMEAWEIVACMAVEPTFSEDWTLQYDSHPFADATKGDDLLPAGTEDYIHIRIQQRNGRKTLTTVQGIADDYDKKKLVKAFKKKFACNGTVIEHPEYGEVIQLQGDQRKNICQFLLEIGIVKEEQLKVHGF
ncbi:eukaryotic translation initiation factor 1b isoform X1 [Grus americana]|uniref:eukaryotic translation initiation factor 1b isoform X1 n=2 Tax=Gruidae TaxID=9109 RepID=UPI0024081AD2|nr:eukaryotic translation initiation factor 1b isoform X1 [Grus americana]